MPKKILKIIAILFLGAIGGFCFQVFILPYLINIPYFEQFQFVKNLKERQVIVQPKEEIIIRENKALENAIEKVKKVTVILTTKTVEGKVLNGSGLILSSDGLVVTLMELIPKGSDFNVFIEGEKVEAEILKRNSNQNLVLMKVKKEGLRTSGFAETEKVQLGQEVFLVGSVFNKEGFPQKVVNQGIIKTFTDDYIKTNIFENYLLKGSTLFDIGGNILGLNTIDSQGKVIAIPSEKLKTFAGF